MYKYIQNVLDAFKFFSVAKVEQIKFDATSMHARPDIAAQQKMVDDGSGEAEVSNHWKI